MRCLERSQTQSVILKPLLQHTQWQGSEEVEYEGLRTLQKRYACISALLIQFPISQYFFFSFNWKPCNSTRYKPHLTHYSLPRGWYHPRSPQDLLIFTFFSQKEHEYWGPNVSKHSGLTVKKLSRISGNSSKKYEKELKSFPQQIHTKV